MSILMFFPHMPPLTQNETQNESICINSSSITFNDDDDDTKYEPEFFSIMCTFIIFLEVIGGITITCYVYCCMDKNFKKKNKNEKRSISQRNTEPIGLKEKEVKAEFQQFRKKIHHDDRLIKEGSRNKKKPCCSICEIDKKKSQVELI